MNMQIYQRQYYLDWLRIAAIMGVLFFHSAMPFAAEEGWHIKNNETSYLFTEFNFMLSRFRMPLLFFISGTVSYFMLQKYGSGKEFIKQRFLRLFIPLLFGMLVIVPPQIYLERVNQGFQGSYWDFYPTVFRGKPYPEGNTSWHHLWFILYLFIYDILSVPLFMWLLKEKSKSFKERLGWFANGKRIYLFTIPTIIVFASLALKFPVKNNLVDDWMAFFYWWSFMLAGYLMITNLKLMDSLERNRRTSLLLAFILYILVNYLRWNKHEPWSANNSNWKSLPSTYAYLSVYPAIAWMMIMALVGYAKHYINKKRSVLNYCNEALYPFYILHQTIIVILAFYVVQLKESILAKYFFIVILTFIISLLIHHLIIRPNKYFRVLFGMRIKKQIKKEELIIPVKEEIMMAEAV